MNAMQPRMLITFDEELYTLAMPVQINVAIDVVDQAGKPKMITGFQTYDACFVGIWNKYSVQCCDYV